MQLDVEKTEFVGYDTLNCDGKIEAIVNGGEKSALATEGENAVIILDKTPFYGESGGQAGDCGSLTNGRGGIFRVETTAKNAQGVILHIGKVERGTFELSDNVTAEVCGEIRESTMRNHTSAHLMQAALRKVLGTHVEQAGQLVNGERMRFDFTHFSALTPEEIKEVETLVNTEILRGQDVVIKEMPIDEAKKMGAMALFGEKYGDVVRVVRAGDFSTELCGGTHVSNTAKIGLFRIVSETSVAAGVRRIEAVTGSKVLELMDEYEATIRNTASALKTSLNDLTEKAKAVTAEIKEKDRMIESLEAKLAGGQLDRLMSQAVEIKGISLVTGKLNVDEPDALRSAADRIKDKPGAVALLACVTKKGTVSFAAACGKDAVKLGAHAGNIVKAAAQIAGGNGGGRPDSAMAGGKDLAKIEAALASAADTLTAQLV